MGLFDKMKGIVKGAQNAVQGEPQTTAPTPQNYPAGTMDMPADTSSAQDDNNDEHEHGDAFDVAGFDPVNDEAAFFNAVLHMESEGQYGGTDESRAEIMQKY